MKVQEFIRVTSSDEITILDGEEQHDYFLDHSDVSEILNNYGNREVYIITATGKDQVEIILCKDFNENGK